MSSEENQFGPVFSFYHKVGSLLPLPNKFQKLLQVYFMGDKQTEVNQHCANISGLKREVTEDLQRILHKYAPLVNIGIQNSTGSNDIR